jgi:hypothetical protein
MKPSPWRSPRCPICGAGFALKQRPTAETLKLIEEAIEAHLAQHAKIAASGHGLREEMLPMSVAIEGFRR